MAREHRTRLPFLPLLALVIVTLTFGQSKPAQQSASAIIEQMRPSVVQVWAQAAEGPSGGSGFVVATNYVITNCHVVGICRTDPILTNPRVMVRFRVTNFSSGSVQMKESFQGVPAQIIDTDFVNDLTLVKLPDGGGMRPVFGDARTGMQKVVQLQFVSTNLSDAALSDGTEVFISGFPFLEPSLVTQRGISASAVEREDVFAYHEDLGNHSDVILLDAMVNHGNSGGPVYLAQTGEVIGVAEAFVGVQTKVVTVPPTTPPTTPQPPFQPSFVVENTGLGVAIPAKYVIALMAKNHLVAPSPTR